MGPSGRVTRSGLLAVLGSGAVAGCNALDGLSSDSEVTIRSSNLPDAGRDGEIEPRLRPSVPVEIGDAYLDSVRGRISSLLAQLPTPFEPAEIPNGYVRHHLTEAAEEATTQLDNALTAGTRFWAMESLRRARGEARYAAAGWSVADEGLTVAEVQRDRRQWRSEARTFREAREYVGTDPIRATLVHARIEEAIERAMDLRVHVSPGNDVELLTVAEWGGAAETTQALVADARHLDDQFTALHPADTGTVEPTLSAAAETLLAEVRSRRTELPLEPTADQWSPGQEVIGELRWIVERGPQRIADAAGPASAIIEANTQLVALQAAAQFDVDTGAVDTLRPENAEAVHAIRSGALDAVQNGLDAGEASGLSRTVLTDAARRIAAADRDLARFEGDVQISRLDRAVAGYVLARTLAEAAPDVSGETIDTIKSS